MSRRRAFSQVETRMSSVVEFPRLCAESQAPPEAVWMVHEAWELLQRADPKRRADGGPPPGAALIQQRVAQNSSRPCGKSL